MRYRRTCLLRDAPWRCVTHAVWCPPQDVRTERGNDVLIMLVGNKTDLQDKRCAHVRQSRALVLGADDWCCLCVALRHRRTGAAKGCTATARGVMRRWWVAALAGAAGT